jgi:hypothetical protein
MNGWSGKRSFLALAMLVWASCGGSSGGSPGDALGTGGVTGGGGTGGPPSGSAATGGSGPGATGGSTGGGYGGTSGGSGGTSGGYGGSGGTPSVCSDPAYPKYCPATPDVPAICWSAGTECSTITKCGNDYRSCLSPNFRYDCAANSCVSSTVGDGGVVAQCPDMLYPVACPAKGDVPALCWSPGTICSTLNRCGNDFKSCQAAGYTFSCTANMCVPDSAPPPDAGVAADASADAASSDAHD